MTKSTSTGVPILVVSLADASDRRQHTTEQLDALGLSFEFVDAVDGRSEMPTGASKLGSVLEIGRPMTGPEVGCARSHAHAYRRIVDSGAGAGLILEDDLTIASELADLMAELDRLPTDWDLTTLFHGGRAQLTGPHRSVTSELAVQRISHAFGTRGYIVRNRAAARLLKCTDPIRLPADELIFRTHPANLRVYGTIPSLVRDGTFGSHIRPAGTAAPSRSLYGRATSKVYRSLRGLSPHQPPAEIATTTRPIER